jgi:hypothetical protein
MQCGELVHAGRGGLAAPSRRPKDYFPQPGNGHTNDEAADSNGQTVT